MNDRELLELAAKAAGMDFEGHTASGVGCYIKGVESKWSPLTDDGDALRLAVALNLNIWRGMWPSKERYVAAQRLWDCNDSLYYDDGVAIDCDPLTATRRAIVRAAADIGEAML